MKRWLPVVLIAAASCKSISFADDPTVAHRNSQASPPRVFEVDWWKPLVAPELLEYQPAETGQPAIDPDTERVIVGTRDGFIRCLKPDDGAIAWEKKTNGKFFAGPTVSMGHVFVPGGNGVLRSIHIMSGEERWQYGAPEELVTAPVVIEGKVLVASQLETLYAVEEESGKWLWQYRRDAPSGFTIRGASQPVVVNGTVFMGFGDGYLVALNLEDGIPLWEKRLTTSGGSQFLDVDTSPVVDQTGKLVVAASYKDGISAHDTKTGDLVWLQTRPGLNAMIERDGVLYTTGDGSVSAMRVSSGQLLWSIDVGDTSPKGRVKNAGRGPVWARGFIVAPTSSGLAFVNPATGLVTEMWNPGKGITATPASFASVHGRGNRLVVLSNLGTVFSLRMVARGG